MQESKEVEDDSALNLEIEQEVQGISVPYLPPLKNRKYTLVLDMDETLIHFQELEGG
jgi:hypothetical protein